MSRKSDVIDLLVTELKRIDKTIDSRIEVPSTPYTFNSNVFNNVFRTFKYLNDINDFPTITLIVGSETRQYIGGGIKYATLDISIRGYTKSENTIDSEDDLAEDIEFIVNSLGYLTDGCPFELVESRIVAIGADEGLFEPFGVVTIEAQITYQVEPNI